MAVAKTKTSVHPLASDTTAGPGHRLTDANGKTDDDLRPSLLLPGGNLCVTCANLFCSLSRSKSLRPTQITVGMREVEEKRKRLRKQKPQKIGSFIGHHMIPIVLGPKKRHYVIDHHHLSLALHKEGLRDVLVTVVLDLSALDLDAFWTVLDHKSLVYPFDAQGRRRDFADIPKTVMQLK